jgi:3-isopropylmalate/(R)-2-methylmalate dehydratase small subunit
MYRENCLQNGILPITLPDAQADQLEAAVVASNGAQPFTVDLVSQEIMGPDGLRMTFDISASDRMRLLEGLDDIGLTLKHRADIEAFEQRVTHETPWSQRADSSSL